MAMVRYDRAGGKMTCRTEEIRMPMATAVRVVKRTHVILSEYICAPCLSYNSFLGGLAIIELLTTSVKKSSYLDPLCCPNHQRQAG